MKNKKNPKKTGEMKIARTFNAPRERVWEAWSEPNLFKQWWGPKDFTSPFVNIDFKEGGKYLNCMQGPDGKQFWSTGNYERIVPYEEIVCSDSFSDEEGNIVSASYYGMSDDFPREMKISIMFEDRGDQTLMSLTHSNTDHMNAEDRDNMEKGWNQSLEKLAAILEKDGPILNY